MKCSNCNADNPQDAHYCHMCGASIKDSHFSSGKTMLIVLACLIIAGFFVGLYITEEQERQARAEEQYRYEQRRAREESERIERETRLEEEKRVQQETRQRAEAQRKAEQQAQREAEKKAQAARTQHKPKATTSASQQNSQDITPQRTYHEGSINIRTAQGTSLHYDYSGYYTDEEWKEVERRAQDESLQLINR